MKFLLLVTTLLFFISCSAEKPQANAGVTPPETEQMGGIAEENDMCICTKDYRPVCGSNGITYGNPCMAGCDDVEEYTQGACK
jgi:uncharacterized lipoprotein YajG